MLHHTEWYRLRDEFYLGGQVGGYLVPKVSSDETTGLDMFCRWCEQHHKDYCQLGPWDIRGFLKDLQTQRDEHGRRLSPKRISDIHWELRLFFKWATDNTWDRNPMLRVAPPQFANPFPQVPSVEAADTQAKTGDVTAKGSARNNTYDSPSGAMV